jgi:3'(2'), 5'-bisphosphate nucleotidase
MTFFEKHKNWFNTAIEASIQASQAISRIYEAGFSVELKEDQSPVTIADKTSSHIISQHLRETGIPIISEEEAILPYEKRRDEEWVWIVDPLDGTKEFIRKNDEFCICIALIHDQNPVFGILADPIRKMILAGGEKIGAYYFSFDQNGLGHKDYQLSENQPNNKKVIAHSRSHFSSQTQRIISSIEMQHGSVDFIRKGSALKFVDLCLGRADFYPRLAPTMEWDIAAGDAIYRAIGGEVLDFTKFEPLKYNKEDLFNPFFIAKSKKLKH